MAFSEPRRNRAPVINITSLIDVMFLLVIFVLLSAKFEREVGVPVDLPKGEADAEARKKSYALTLTDDGRMYLDEEQVALEELSDRVRAKRAALGGDPVLVVRADEAARVGHLYPALELVRAGGQFKIDLKGRD